MGTHAFPRNATSYAHLFADLLAKFDLCVPSTFAERQVGSRHTFQSTLSKVGHRRIDYVCLPTFWSAGVTASYTLSDFDNLQPERKDHWPVGVRLYATLIGTSKQDMVPRFSHRWLSTRDPQALSQAIQQVQQQDLPPWKADVHAHRQWFHNILHASMDGVPKRKETSTSPTLTTQYGPSPDTKPGCYALS